ncbi:39S mitochondrial ribosomal protein L46-domain-containing protein [Paraphoma chrysanthemicola]|uniref:Large ribosomal subunit protein mL46 n=1 Tax=Paraphoma chrysanthemicola TaxID=798071 RepID=A0A8K0VS37_9PLEO|nr:39S mitochondrial ribosomal protein L46-domain-containing protein [Paraphoma chrysanthemicola]
MNAGQRTTRQLASRAGQQICRSCQDSISRRTYAAAAAAVQAEDPVSQHIPPVAQTAPSTSYAINAGVVLSRPPQITRDLHPFESAFFLYQRRLNERLALPFTRYFYFKKRTPADLEWKRKMKQRLTPARDIGKYQGYGDEAWNDELLVGSKESNFEWQVERLLEDAGTDGKAAGEVEQRGMKKVEREEFDKPMSRRTEADEKNDTKSLSRALQRTLYLLVKNKDGQWQFPQDRLNDENLHGAASRIITQSGGPNMNTWLVGHVPIGHHQLEYTKGAKLPSGITETGAKTFFLRARIMAGQVNLKENKLGLQDFKWLAKDELEKEVDGSYWKSVKNMLAER